MRAIQWTFQLMSPRFSFSHCRSIVSNRLVSVSILGIDATCWQPYSCSRSLSKCFLRQTRTNAWLWTVPDHIGTAKKHNNTGFSIESKTKDWFRWVLIKFSTLATDFNPKNFSFDHAGVTLSRESDGVWIYNRSTLPVFVHSPTLYDMDTRYIQVYKVPPGHCLRAFDPVK